MKKYLMFLLPLLFTAMAVHADNAPLPLKVDGRLVSSKNNRGKNGSKVQSKQLEVRIISLSDKDYGKLRVKFVYFARDLKTKEVSEESDQEIETVLEGRQAVVRSVPEDFKSIQKHYTGTIRRNRNGRVVRNTLKKVAASGQEYAGWGIIVTDAQGKVLGKDYSASHLDR